MSRFFHAGSDSESDSDSSVEELQPQRPVPGRAYTFSDDEEDTKRVVRSEKDKRYDEIRTIIKQMKNHKNIKDMPNVLTDFESLGKAYEKARKVVDKEGIPRFFLQCLCELDDFVNDCWEDREWRKQISKNNSKSLTSLRQKLKKYIREFETELGSYRENPDEEEVGEKEAVVEDEGVDDKLEPTKADIPSKKEARIAKEPTMSGDEGDESDESEFWGSSSSDSESESEDERPEGGRLTAEYFLKKTTEAESQRREERKRERKREKELKKKAKEEEEGEWEEVKGGAPLVVEKPKMFSKDQEINHEAVMKKLFEIISARGKKGTDRSEQIELLKELKLVAETANLGPAVAVKIMFNIMAAIFDYNPNIATCMRNEMWTYCMSAMKELLDLLITNEDITVGENIAEDNENVETSPYQVRGCVLTTLERMDEEFTKMLQGCDAHSTEYVDRLQDEYEINDMTKRLQKYLEQRGTSEELCRIYLRRIEHIYYKFDHSCFEPEKEGAGDAEETSSEDDMDRLCKYIYAKDSTDRLRTRAMLCHIYHHALHDRWFQARDLMLMSHLQDSIQHSDVPTQIMYNRTLVQLGLCAFRQGMIRDAHNALVDIQSSNRAKELLAQGLLPQRQHERTPEQEKIEKRRLFPFHKHINLELLECVYLVSAMLLEIPYMAAHELDIRRRMISKNFHHVMKMSDRQTLTGPPESMREHVVAASKAMKMGDWKVCKNFIINDKMNAKVWDLFYQKDKVRDMIVTKIQEESLRTYLFTYSSVYDSLIMDHLAEMFELKKPVVHSIISKMIINEELMASLDQPTQTVNMHRTEPSRLQSLALQLSEKVSTLVENNERIMEIKQGNYYFPKTNQPQYYQQNQGQNWNRGDQGRQGGWNRGDQGRQGGWNRGEGRQGGWNRDRDQDRWNQNQGWGRRGNRDNRQRNY
ncbi:eukaryotic translation initiation factor 3 subunit C-like isoform X3 [Gigantopelta aegis]|uniref:eukaryotic translation initiation factor 3 subunit C-like isoform X2 n=1 Tax=Gigantopelta aegis TaxID=1735272 RepID=UPI001B887A38|nr:eukaryotic translation initiation factor 3 subunit C-like isoform X2 [Gigantopelta aegis]XP_041347426.1 eukaryotic translation initiation factor 3 subunit C-like isoform X3 [Gigantopelta aegis]